jgi:hypothetical protein
VNLTNPRDFGLDETPSLKVVIAYEDFATGQRAMRTCQRLMDELGQEFQVRTSLWKFEVLRLPSLKKAAAEDAAEAEMVIISAHGMGDLPAEVHDWMALWLTKKQGGASALVALLDAAKDDAEGRSPAQSYLQGMARKANLDFFSRAFPVSDVRAEFSFERIAARAEATSSVLEGILHQKHPPSRYWGLTQ